MRWGPFARRRALAIAEGRNPMRTFTVYRWADISETHDSNQSNAPDEPQFEGVIFRDGTCVLRWLTAKRSVAVWDSFEDMMAVHGHPEYRTEIVWQGEGGGES